MKKLQLHENTFNTALGEALRKVILMPGHNVDNVLDEVRNTTFGRERPDVLIYLKNSLPVIIECAFDSAGADKDAVARLRLELKNRQKVFATISLHISSEFKSIVHHEKVVDRLLSGKEGDLKYAVYQYYKRTNRFVRFPEYGHIEGNLYGLADIIPKVVLSTEKIEELGEEVAQDIKVAAAYIEKSMTEIQIQGLSKIVEQYSPISIIKTSMVLWLNAFMVQSLLSSNNEGIQPLPISSPENPAPSDVLKSWRSITDTNWVNIFNPAIKSLERINDLNQITTPIALKILLDCASKIYRSNVGENIHFGCELFPKISDNRKESAAFYTREPTAEFLSNLTIREEDLTVDEWSNPDFFKKYKIADFACGTGTLLRAGYRRLMFLIQKVGGGLTLIFIEMLFKLDLLE